MGCGSRAGKMQQHASGKPAVNAESGHFALLQRNVCALLILGPIFLVIGSLLFCRRMKNGAR